MSQPPPIFVTEPHLPRLEDFLPYLERIWSSRRLTNGGPFHQQLEHALAEYLGVEHLSLFANGTLALVTAMQALRITGEVITTPFSFPATTHSLYWNAIKPVFVYPFSGHRTDTNVSVCLRNSRHDESARSRCF